MSKIFEVVREYYGSSDVVLGRFSSRAKAEAYFAKGVAAEEYWADSETVIREEKLLPVDDLVDAAVLRVFHACMLLDDGTITERHHKNGLLILTKPFRERITQDVFRASCNDMRPAIRVQATTEAGCIRVANKFREKWLKEQK